MALAGLGLAACGPKPADQAGPAPAETSALVASNTEAALDVAATPAAGTEAANVAAATDPGPPPANIADVRDAAGDEGSLEAKGKVANAKEAGRMIPPKPAQ
jgi:hypothetical protein